MLLAGKDHVTGIAYDFSGKRMATACADHTVRVYDRSDSWSLNDTWRAHDAVVSATAWAGPYTLPILATASFDCTVKIWEEAFDEGFETQKRWKRRHVFTEFEGPVYACAFNLQCAQLQLAAIAADGVLRLFTCPDPGNLGAWEQQTEVSLLNRPVARQLQSSFSLSWAPTESFINWIVVGALDDTFVLKPRSADSAAQYDVACQLQGHGGLVRDVAWAPTFGVSAGIIATACKDGYVRIYAVKKAKENKETVGPLYGGVTESRELDVQPVKSADGGETAIEAELLLESDEHHGEVWRVAWNASGSILASTGNDADVKFWKSMFRGTYKCIAEVHQ